MGTDCNRFFVSFQMKELLLYIKKSIHVSIKHKLASVWRDKTCVLRYFGQSSSSWWLLVLYPDKSEPIYSVNGVKYICWGSLYITQVTEQMDQFVCSVIQLQVTYNRTIKTERYRAYSDALHQITKNETHFQPDMLIAYCEQVVLLQ